MQQLHLDLLQTRRMLKLLERHPEPEIGELKDVLALQAATIRTMLASDSDDNEPSLEARMGHKKLCRNHPQWVTAENFTLSTSKELAKARAYLEWCGYRPALLDHWKNLLYDHGSSGAENGRVSESHLLSVHEAETVRSISTPQPKSPKSKVMLSPHPAAPNPKPPSQPLNRLTPTLYPISPDSSPPPHKVAKLHGRKNARHSYPSAESSSALPSSQRAFVSRHRKSSRASSSRKPDEGGDGDGRPGGVTATKNQRAAGQRRKRVISSSSTLSTNSSARNAIGNTVSAKRTWVSTNLTKDLSAGANRRQSE